MAERANVMLRAEAGDSRTPTDLVRNILQDVGRIIRAEVRLARAELVEKAQKAGKAGGFMGGAAVAGLLAAASLVTACIAALALVMAVWLAALIMGVLLGMAAGGAFLMGRKRLKTVDPVPQRTVQTLKDDVEWAKQRTH
jgi:hypothetical protein